MSYCCNYGSECLLCWAKALPQGRLLIPLLPCYFSAQVCKFEAVRNNGPFAGGGLGSPPYVSVLEEQSGFGRGWLCST